MSCACLEYCGPRGARVRPQRDGVGHPGRLALTAAPDAIGLCQAFRSPANRSSSSPPPAPGSMANLQTNILLRSEETGGHVSVTEIVVPPGNAGPPLHTHDFDEAFYMLDGELIFQVEDALVTKCAGELTFAPRNVAHALANHS